MKIDLGKKSIASSSEKSLMNMHGILNVINIVYSLMSQMHIQYDKKNILKSSLKLSKEIIDMLSNLEESGKLLNNFDSYQDQVMSSIEATVKEYPEMKDEELITKYISILDALFYMLKINVNELKDIVENPNLSKVYKCDEIEESVFDFLSAIEKNSLGKYRVLSNIAQKSKNDYLVNFSVDSEYSDKVEMPIVFNSVIRDTIANARKYTRTGGVINAGLYDENNHLIYVVKDEGMGIPKDEIEQVVKFGVRGSNTSDIKSFGRGIGLSKACEVTRHFGGEMWIDSKENEGTTVKIKLPKDKFILKTD